MQTAKGTPIPDAVILHRKSGQKSLSDEKGIFMLPASDDTKIVLEVIHPDYIEQEVSISKKILVKKSSLHSLPIFGNKRKSL